MNVINLFQEAESTDNTAQINLEILSTNLQTVEKYLLEEAFSEVPLVNDISKHTLLSGGKRLRPLLTILSNKCTEQKSNEDSLIHIAASMEMLHMATLIHDDVVDNSDTRRGKPTASYLYGNTASILSGDVLLAKSMKLLAIYGGIEIIKEVSEAMIQLAEGQVLEIESRGKYQLSTKEYFKIIHLKTASLLSCCCKVGAMLGKSHPNYINALFDYGYHIGIAFQIVDDIIDYQQKKESSGKPMGLDYREGCVTMPLIFARELANDEDKVILTNLFGKNISDAEMNTVNNILTSSGAFDKSKAIANLYVEKACTAIEVLPNNVFKDILLSSAAMVVERTK